MDSPLHCSTDTVFFKRKSGKKPPFFVLVIGTYCSLKSTNFEMYFDKSD